MNSNINLDRRVVCAANRCGAILLIAPRHWDETMHKQYEAVSNYAGGIPPSHKFEHGFINTWGEFLTRKEAWMVASYNNQIIHICGNQHIDDVGIYGTELFSENLY